MSYAIPDGCFKDETPGRTLIVRESDGAPQFAVEGGELVPYAGWKAGFGFGGQVRNPEGFTGFPEHDKDAPLSLLAAHGLDATHFVHFEAEHPLVVRHIDGVATHRVRGDALEAVA